MLNKLVVVENFFDDADSVRHSALDTISSMHDNLFNDDRNHYPGCRSEDISICAPHIYEELKSKLEFHTGIKYTELFAVFHLTTGSHGRGMIHIDTGYYSAGVVYLNEFSTQNTGTKILRSNIPGLGEPKQLIPSFRNASTTKDYDIVQNFIKEKNYYDDDYRESIVVHAEYNRLVTYGANYLHTPDDYFGFNLYNSRLTLALATKL